VIADNGFWPTFRISELYSDRLFRLCDEAHNRFKRILTLSQRTGGFQAIEMYACSLALRWSVKTHAAAQGSGKGLGA